MNELFFHSKKTNKIDFIQRPSWIKSTYHKRYPKSIPHLFYIRRRAPLNWQFRAHFADLAFVYFRVSAPFRLSVMFHIEQLESALEILMFVNLLSKTIRSDGPDPNHSVELSGSKLNISGTSSIIEILPTAFSYQSPVKLLHFINFTYKRPKAR